MSLSAKIEKKDVELTNVLQSTRSKRRDLVKFAAPKKLMSRSFKRTSFTDALIKLLFDVVRLKSANKKLFPHWVTSPASSSLCAFFSNPSRFSRIMRKSSSMTGQKLETKFSAAQNNPMYDWIQWKKKQVVVYRPHSAEKVVECNTSSFILFFGYVDVTIIWLCFMFSLRNPLMPAERYWSRVKLWNNLRTTRASDMSVRNHCLQ